MPVPGRKDHQRRADEGRAREDAASFAHPESERGVADPAGRGVADVEERGRLDGARNRGKEDVEVGDDRRVLREVADRVVRPEDPRAAHRLRGRREQAERRAPTRTERSAFAAAALGVRQDGAGLAEEEADVGSHRGAP